METDSVAIQQRITDRDLEAFRVMAVRYSKVIQFFSNHKNERDGKQKEKSLYE